MTERRSRFFLCLMTIGLAGCAAKNPGEKCDGLLQDGCAKPLACVEEPSGGKFCRAPCDTSPTTCKAMLIDMSGNGVPPADGCCPDGLTCSRASVTYTPTGKGPVAGVPERYCFPNK